MKKLPLLDGVIKYAQQSHQAPLPAGRESLGPSSLIPGWSGCIPPFLEDGPWLCSLPCTFSLALAGLAQRPATEHADNLPAHAGILQWCHCTLGITSGQQCHSAVMKQEEPVQESLLKLQMIPGFLAERPGAGETNGEKGQTQSPLQFIASQGSKRSQSWEVRSVCTPLSTFILAYPSSMDS